MTYTLRRIGDNAGDSGQMSLAIFPERKTGSQPDVEHDARPQVGACMRVGSIYARSYYMQDWWQTTPIIEILEDTPERVVFKTGNSVYEWKCI